MILKSIPIIVLMLFCSTQPLLSQKQQIIAWNAWADAELSFGQEQSSFYYNEISSARNTLRFGVSDLNLLAEIKLHPSWSLHLRGQLIRERGGALRDWRLPLAHVKYAPLQKNWSLSLGRFLMPFGEFVDRQHPKDRPFINLPLTFAYYTNISPRIGFDPQMGEDKFLIDGQVEWGSTWINYGGYANGLRLDWDLVPDKLSGTVALTDGSPNQWMQPLDLSQWAIMTRLKFKPTFFWEQGVSLSHGTFFENVPENASLNSPFQQTLVGTDVKLGYGFWELRGELVGVSYQTPRYFPVDSSFSPESLRLHAGSWSVNLVYEFPKPSGLYAAYGVESLLYERFQDAVSQENLPWDQNVLRHNLAVGYTITPNLLLRVNYMHQDVKGFPAWQQDTWRAVLTAYY